MDQQTKKKKYHFLLKCSIRRNYPSITKNQEGVKSLMYIARIRKYGQRLANQRWASIYVYMKIAATDLERHVRSNFSLLCL